MRVRILSGLIGALALAGCSIDAEQAGGPSDGTGSAGTTSDGGTGGCDDGGGNGDGSGEGSGDDGADGDDVKFDIAGGADVAGSPGDPDGEEGCEKVDFLFVVDNSESMDEEQENLVDGFPAFMLEIQNTVKAQDYHIMVIDSDANHVGGSCHNIMFSDDDCDTWCPECRNTGCSCKCGGTVCPMPPHDECDLELGGGKVSDPGFDDCGVVGGNRYVVDGQPDLPEMFSCLATVGTSGVDTERPMEAMVRSVTSLDQAGECNEGFLRDDAVLVVTFITDEDDGEDDGLASAGDPQSWKEALVEAKGGNEAAMVVLGFIDDSDVPGGVCPESDHSQPGVILRGFAESFTYGQWCSICSPDYMPCFLDAVSVIDIACDEFEPPP